jgi:pimeloyl-ACP methyl ester carboxylesterase
VDQTTTPLRAGTSTLTGNALTVEFPTLNGGFTGTLDDAAHTIAGNWRQNGRDLPLVLKPGTIKPTALSRAPQPGDMTLAVPGGTLAATIWKADSKLAAVIITGSGPANRNGDSTTNGGRGTYRMIAEGLQAQGINALSFDKRGIGESAPAALPPEQMTVNVRANDVKRLATELKTRVDAKCVWLVGHSEGGLIAILAAQGNADICGIVTLAGMGRSLDVLLREQLPRVLPEPLKAKLGPALDDIKAGKPVDAPQLGPMFAAPAQPYMRSEMVTDPAAILARTRFPVLILQGDADENMSPADPQALAKARPDATLAILPGMDHSLRIAKDDPGSGPSPLVPGLVDRIAKFMHDHS